MVVRGGRQVPHAGALLYGAVREADAEELHSAARRARARVVAIVAAVGATTSHGWRLFPTQSGRVKQSNLSAVA